MATNQEKFEMLLSRDKDLYSKLAQWKSGLASFERKIEELGGTENISYELARQYYEEYLAYKNALQSYNARQKDIQSSKALQAASALESATDKVTSWAKSWWNKTKDIIGYGQDDGLGALPAVLLVPAVKVIGIVIVAGIAAHYVHKYFDKTVIDYDASIRAIERLAKIDPIAAREAAKGLSKAKIAETENSALTQVGKGAKTALVVGAIGATLVVAAKHGLFDAKKTTKQKQT